MDRLCDAPLRPAPADFRTLTSVEQAVLRLDVWLETMRAPEGYAGPVAHWWQSCLLYSGAMADWRYEGILAGYVQLYRVDPQPRWLARALTAGDDLLRAQLPNANYQNSSFEIGPLEGGTPHEAAVNVGLLELARLLRAKGDLRWQRYMQAAERNIEAYLLGRLWNGTAFLDQAWNETLVPNKNATTMEALLLYEELSGRSMEQYIHAAARLVGSGQVRLSGPRAGATVHLGTGPFRLAIGIYTARCAAALVRLYRRYPRPEYLEWARSMGLFLLRQIVAGGTRFGYYADGRPIDSPLWISASGDLLRALIVLRPYGDIPDEAINTLTDMLVSQQYPSGGMPTTYGLGAKGRVARHTGLPDFRDLLPVVGWCDKAFRALTLQVERPLPEAPVGLTHAFERPCVWKGQLARFSETDTHIQLYTERNGRTLYDWVKGESYPCSYQI